MGERPAVQRGGGRVADLHAERTPERVVSAEHDGRGAEDRADAGGIFIAEPGENSIERMEEPAQGAFHQPLEPVAVIVNF